METTNYTAHIKVVKTVRPDPTQQGHSMSITRQTEPKREKQEALELTVKAPTMERLKEKLVQHVGLLDEDDVQ